MRPPNTRVGDAASGGRSSTHSVGSGSNRYLISRSHVSSPRVLSAVIRPCATSSRSVRIRQTRGLQIALYPAMRRDWLAIIVVVVEIAIGVTAAVMLYAVWLDG